jgi:hypothetical protein
MINQTLRQLIREEIQRRLDEANGAKPSEQARQLGLKYVGFGRWLDPERGKIVAKTIDGQLVKMDRPEEPANEDGEEPATATLELMRVIKAANNDLKMARKKVMRMKDNPHQETMLQGIDTLMDMQKQKYFGSEGEFYDAGTWEYKPKGLTHINPGWNAGMKMKGDDIAFDGHAEQTVQKLLAKVGDPKKLLTWLLKKFEEESPNGKKRIMQYVGILKKMGIVDDPDAEPEVTDAPVEEPAPEPQTPPEAPKKQSRLFSI